MITLDLSSALTLYSATCASQNLRQTPSINKTATAIGRFLAIARKCLAKPVYYVDISCIEARCFAKLWFMNQRRVHRRPTYIQKSGDKRTTDKPDFWQRASIISSIFSSIIIAGVGLFISYRLQSSQIASAAAISQSQIDVARFKNADDTRLQEAKIAADMLQELVRSDAKHRAAVLIMIQPYLTKERYAHLCTALAQEDEGRVRQVAFEQLAKTPTKSNLNVLQNISRDKSTPAGDRVVAERGVSSIESALVVAERIRTLSNSQSSLKVAISMSGCKGGVCVDGEKFSIRAENQSQQPLWLYIYGVDSDGSVSLIYPNSTTMKVDPGSGPTIGLTASKPYGPAVLRVIGSTVPFTDPARFLLLKETDSWATAQVTFDTRSPNL